MTSFQPAPYPDPSIEVLDSRFNKYRIGKVHFFMTAGTSLYALYVGVRGLS